MQVHFYRYSRLLLNPFTIEFSLFNARHLNGCLGPILNLWLKLKLDSPSFKIPIAIQQFQPQ